MNIIKFMSKNRIGKPPWDYYFLKDLEEKEYPVYLAELFKLNTGENLPLLKEWSFKSGIMSYKIDKKKLKTFNQKIQWIKLYGITPLMQDCTDKVTVRDYVREHIGTEYLKPVLQIIPNDNNDISTCFDKINFEKLPESFVIKCNHGCKWQYIIKDKNNFLNNKRLFDIVKQNITGWLEQDYSLWGGFEMQYNGILPQILIEKFLQNFREIEVYCFNGIPQIFRLIHNKNTQNVSIFDKKLNNITGLKFLEEDYITDFDINNIFKQTIDNIINLSIKLAEKFIFVRIDWLLFQEKFYFNELTFTPFSGFCRIKNDKWNKILGELINLERIDNGF